MTVDILQHLDHHKQVAIDLVFLDFRKAFDTVPSHRLLLNKLSTYMAFKV